MRTAIYETKGRAREYSELALNLFKGCSHGCIYCCAPLAKRMSRTDFRNESYLFAQSSDEIIQSAVKFERRGETRPVLLCFTCDPYQPEEAKTQRTRQAIEILHAHGLKVIILTKAGIRATRDFDLLGLGDQFAVSLTGFEATRKKWEPYAAGTMDRLDALQIAHDLGIPTWVSLEPVLDPDETLDLIRDTRHIADHYKLGKLNYHGHSSAIDWEHYLTRAQKLLNSLKKTYYVKKDLALYAGKEEGYWVKPC